MLFNLSAHEIGFDTSAERELFNNLVQVWQKHYQSNYRNEKYYYQKINPDIVSKASPNEVKESDIVLGWPTKAVDMLVSRSVFQGFVSDDEDDAAFLKDMFVQNSLSELYRQAATSQLIDSCSFLTITQGAGKEPEIMIGAHPASYAAAIWDMRKRRIKAGVVIVDIEEKAFELPQPTQVNMYTDEFTYVCRRLQNNAWSVDRMPNPLGRPLIEPMRYRPDLNRPFGRSRISPAVRSLTDRALAVCFRTDVSAEFYTYPQRYLLGVDRKTAEEAAKRKIETYIDHMLMITANANGDIPQYGQLSQMSMQPHDEQLQTLAKLFSGETGIPMTSLGVVFDNPASADAIYAAQSDLITDAEWLNAANGASLQNIASMALAYKYDTTLEELAPEIKSVRATFKDPVRPSMSARADFAVKIASAAPGYSQTKQFWRDLGYDEAETQAIMKDMRQANALALLMQQAQGLAATSQEAMRKEGDTDGDTI